MRGPPPPSQPPEPNEALRGFLFVANFLMIATRSAGLQALGYDPAYLGWTQDEVMGDQILVGELPSDLGAICAAWAR